MKCAALDIRHSSFRCHSRHLGKMSKVYGQSTYEVGIFNPVTGGPVPQVQVGFD